MDPLNFSYRVGENTRNKNNKVPEDRLIYKANEFIPPSESKTESTPLNTLPSVNKSTETYHNAPVNSPVVFIPTPSHPPSHTTSTPSYTPSSHSTSTPSYPPPSHSTSTPSYPPPSHSTSTPSYTPPSHTTTTPSYTPPSHTTSTPSYTPSSHTTTTPSYTPPSHTTTTPSSHTHSHITYPSYSPTTPSYPSPSYPQYTANATQGRYNMSGNTKTGEMGNEGIIGLIMKHMGNKLPMQIVNSYVMKYKYMGGTDKWTKDKISNLLRELNNHYEESKTGIPSSELESGEFYEDKIKIVVRSDERNIIKYPQPTDFYISLFPPNGIAKVKEFKLLSCIFPKNPNEDNLSINDFPYIILQIKEIGNQFIGKNGKIAGFCPLTFTTDTGQYKIFHGETSPFTTKAIFPNKNLAGLSISFLLPNGDPFLFNPLIINNTTKKGPTITEEIEYNPDPFSTPSNKSVMEITADSEGTTDNYPVITLLFEMTYLRKRENYANLY